MRIRTLVAYARMFALAIGSLVVAAQPSLAAEDDGGGRSMFARGAGNRALGLGGAFGALANDASAPLWNPGGLGLLSRSELEFSQTSYYGFDMQEQYASLVLPHWRWGVASVTFRRFGVDGIEQRDDRNTQLATDLSSNETEIIIGYGRGLRKAWGVGGAVKFRHQSLAGFNGSGVGFDVGVLARPLLALYPNSVYGNRFSMGLSVRNLLEPKIRLANESVADPMGIRFGSAYFIPLFKDRSLLASVDVEKTQDMNVRLHSGLEVAIPPFLALRAGVNDGSLTAGSSVRWHGVAVNYTFEQNDIEDVHRIGASFWFGPTVHESRRAAIERRESELQARLAEAFEARQSIRIRELLAEADGAKANGDHDDALEILAVVAALEPDNVEASKRQAACYREVGRKLESDGDFAAAAVSYSRALGIVPDDPDARTGYERCRAESDRVAERSEQLRRLFANALDAFSVHDLKKAEEGFSAILEVNPNDREASEMLRRTRQAIDYRVVSLLEQASRMIEWGHYDEAASDIEEARRLDPDAKGINRAGAKLASARSGGARGEVPDRTDARDSSNTMTTLPVGNLSTQPLSDKKKREAEELYKRAVAAMADNASDKAIKYLELVWSIDPSYKGAAEHLKREYMTRGMEYFADGKYDEAVAFWENALRIDPTDERTKGYLSRAREQSARTRQILGNNR
jgi:tetratricopeptide (TPR) repeat protein